ncbi:DUF1499 domain-containing protein [Meridianimarinicoccus sp. MJW13]|uniref:DUF1499 domain-containing protein n=1 Tax=Meridianimarinicoccus sp. MJW13 TaxID=2720031 RepID=UPI001D00B3C9|nr:DUF1499 domain-containing protein [Fluviibacterium sp. MJW13]
MRVMVWIAIGLAMLVAAAMLYVRLAPSDPAVWHVDPLTVTRPQDKAHVLYRPGDGDQPGVVVAAAPDQALAALTEVALQTPRVRVLAESPDRVTFVARSALWGFPDYISVRAIREGEGTRLVLFSRQRFGRDDLGINAARVTAWMQALQSRSLPNPS